MNIDVSLYNFYKDKIVTYWSYNILVHLPIKLFYLNADWKIWRKKYRKHYTQDSNFPKFIYTAEIVTN